jgi:hypothetical protein
VDLSNIFRGSKKTDTFHSMSAFSKIPQPWRSGLKLYQRAFNYKDLSLNFVRSLQNLQPSPGISNDFTFHEQYIRVKHGFTSMHPSLRDLAPTFEDAFTVRQILVSPKEAEDPIDLKEPRKTMMYIHGG